MVLAADGFATQTHLPPFSFTAEQTAVMPAGAIHWETADANGVFLAFSTERT